MKQNIKIALTDDEQLFRKDISFHLQKEPNFEILFKAENGQKLIDNIDPENLPDIVLIDLKTPFFNAVEATKVLREKHPTIKIIALTSYECRFFIPRIIDAGASSSLLKNTSPKIVIHTINELFDKGFYYTNKALKTIPENGLASCSEKRNCDLEKKVLSNREREVLELICAQLTTREIANRLYISPRTVDGHRNNLLLKTGSKNVAGLVIYGIQKKVIKLAVER